MTEPKYRDWSNYSPGALGLVRFRTLILIIRSANHIGRVESRRAHP